MSNSIQSTDELNQAFAIDGVLNFVEVEGQPIAEIDIPEAQARVAMHGGHVFEWRPGSAKDKANVLWTSPTAIYNGSKPIRGGVPICWPWFGAHPDKEGMPAHGVARNTPWRVTGTARLDDAVSISMELPGGMEGVFASVVIEMGEALKVTLTTDNRSQGALVLSEAMHTYFTVGDVRHVQITGLEDCKYIDSIDKEAGLKTQQGEIRFTGETDRVYLDTEATCVIHDPDLGRQIHIAKTGSRSAVVWNPWVEKTKGFADFPDQDWPTMVCVETANAAINTLEVAPGTSHSMAVQISLS